MADDKPYRRSRNANGRWLDYQKVDWAKLADELEGQPHGSKRPILIKWALRLRCSIDTLYKGLKKHKNGDL